MQWAPVVTGIVGAITILIALANMNPDGRKTLRSWLGVSLSLVLELGMPLLLIVLTLYSFNQFVEGSGVPSRKEIGLAIVDIAATLAAGVMFFSALGARAKRRRETMQAMYEAQAETVDCWAAKDKANSSKATPPTDPDDGVSIRKIGKNITV